MTVVQFDPFRLKVAGWIRKTLGKSHRRVVRTGCIEVASIVPKAVVILEHRTQVQAYRQALEESGYSVESGILVYIHENQVTPEFL